MKPIISISQETLDMVEKWRTDAELKDIYGNFVYTDGDLVDKAINIFKKIQWEAQQ